MAELHIRDLAPSMGSMIIAQYLNVSFQLNLRNLKSFYSIVPFELSFLGRRFCGFEPLQVDSPLAIFSALCTFALGPRCFGFDPLQVDSPMAIFSALCTFALSRRCFGFDPVLGQQPHGYFQRIMHFLDKYAEFAMIVNFADLNRLASVRCDGRCLQLCSCFDLEHLYEGKELSIDN